MNTDEIKAIAVRAAETVLENQTLEEVKVQEETTQTQTIEPEVEEEHAQVETTEEACACQNLQPMAEWVKGEEPGICRPCIIGPVVQWYYEELKEKGDTETAAKLEAEVNVLEEDNMEQVIALCEDLDEIKASVPAELRKKLEEFDCTIQIQSFNPDEFSGEVPPVDSPSSSQPLPDSSDSESLSQ